MGSFRLAAALAFSGQCFKVDAHIGSALHS